MKRIVLGCLGLALALCVVSEASASSRRPAPWKAPIVETAPAPAPQAAGSWTFQGCWRPTNGSQCLDVYTDANGNYYICKACGTTRNPSGGKCSPTTVTFLNTRGLWCS